jgi:hypothetical protein
MSDSRIILTPQPLPSNLGIGEDFAWYRATPKQRTEAILWECQKLVSQDEVQRETARRELARVTLQRAVRAGDVVRPDRCSRCGNEPPPGRAINGHHHDYSKPLDVEWLCEKCHTAHHRKVRRGWGPE